jgi:ABC-type nitrate/sulfonate/bicarbonate transport system ATPase subunit
VTVAGNPLVAPGTPVKLLLEGIRKSFPGENGAADLVAVQHADVAIRANEFVTIVGPSGCGKSTLLNIVAGLTEPGSGRILIDGVEAPDRRRHFSYMFQKDLLLPWRTIRGNVALGLEVQGLGRRETRERAQSILDRFGLGNFASHYPSQLSGGMRQRAALMRTLLCDREILLLDEPFGALDALTRSVMQEWLLRIWEADHRTILFITHDVEEAVLLSDRVLVMSGRPGRIKKEVNINLGRPRDHTLTSSPEFVALKSAILEQIYEESVIAAELDMASAPG